jgi:hypothetical protein
MTGKELAEAMAAVVRVGDGRGFIIEHRGQRLVITAAHCLPQIPPAHPARYLHESTFLMLGPLDGEPSIWAECLFVDVMADLAVLGPCDSQEFYEENEAYETFTENRPALRLGDIPPSDLGACRLETHPVHVLQLDGQWVRGQANRIQDGPILLVEPPPKAGMSGSPILNDCGEAIGVISTGDLNPRLLRDLPMWLAPR